jgi:hypothetical protein
MGSLPDAEFEARVVRSFVRGGRLTTIPAQPKKRLAIAHYLTRTCFERGTVYAERQVNERLAEFNEDVATLRREIVEAGLMTREEGEYRRV